MCGEDILEPDDHYATASSLTVNTPIWSLFDTPDDEDWFSIDAVAGATYTIKISDLAEGADTRIEVYDAGVATCLATDDGGGGNLASLVTWTAPASWRFYIRVLPLATSTTG